MVRSDLGGARAGAAADSSGWLCRWRGMHWGDLLTCWHHVPRSAVPGFHCQMPWKARNCIITGLAIVVVACGGCHWNILHPARQQRSGAAVWKWGLVATQPSQHLNGSTFYCSRQIVHALLRQKADRTRPDRQALTALLRIRCTVQQERSRRAGCGLSMQRLTSE